MKVFTFYVLSKIYLFRTDDAVGIILNQCWKYDQDLPQNYKVFFAGCDKEPAGFRDQLFNG